MNRGKSGRNNTADPVGSRIKIVHPVTPEWRELRIRSNDAIEQGEHDKEEGQDIAYDGKTRCEGRYPLTLFDAISFYR